MKLARSVRVVKVLTVAFLFGLSSMQSHAVPQKVTLQTGETVIGVVLEKSDESTLYLKSDLLGELAISRSSIASSLVLEPAGAPPLIAAASVPEQSPAVAEPVSSGSEAAETDEGIVDRLAAIDAPKSWSGDLKVGLNTSRGDRRWDETYVQGDVEVEPEGSPHSFRLSGSYNYRLSERDDGSEFKSTDRYDSTFTYRRTFLQDWFVQNATGYRADQLKGINREIQNAIGLGYRFKPSPKFELLFGGGGGVEYFDADFEEARTNDMVVNLFQEFTYQPYERASFVQEFKYFQNPEDSDSYNYVFKAAVRLRLTNLLGFEVSYNKDFDNEVREGDVEDDTQIRNALVVYF